MTSKASRALLIAATTFLAARLFLSFILPAWNAVSTDFPNYYTASWALMHGEDLRSLYDPVAFNVIAARAGIRDVAVLFNYFPPLSAVLTVPVVAFSPLNALRIWILVNLVALGALVYLVSRHSGLGFLQTTFVALLAGDALGNNFVFGQVYLPLAVLLLLGFVWADSRPKASGFVLAFAVAIKVFPVVFLLYLVCQKRWKALACTGLCLAALVGVSVLALGWEAHRIYLIEALPRMMRGEVQDPYHVGWNQLQSLLRRSLVPEPSLNPHPLFDAPAAFFFLKVVLNLVILWLSGMALRDRRMKPLLAFNVLFLAVSLTSPGQASYHYVLLIPGMAMLASSSRNAMRIASVVGLALICSSGLDTARMSAVLLLWAGFIWWIRPRMSWAAVTVIAIVGAIASSSEMRRWQADEIDGAVMAAPEQHGFVEVEPRFTSAGLEFKSMVATGWATRSIALPEQSASATDVQKNWSVYSTFERGNWDVGVKDLRTGQTRILTSSLANDFMPVLSPDGREVFFASDRRRGYRFTAIYRMPIPR